jgi:2-isopropylmalate synthase
MKPEDVGIYQTRLILGKHSGKAALKEQLAQLGYKLCDDALDDVFKRFKKLADAKPVITDFDIEGLVIGEKETAEYTLASFVVNSGTDITSTAVVRLINNGKEREHVARGETPVIAAFRAVDKIVKHSYPLVSWSIGSIAEGREALGESVVKIQSCDKIITGRGTHTDIVEACIKAYVSAINRALKLDATQ